ncbi:MAG: leucine--tRNA ligase, partial [Calditrichaeota bacterium]
RFHFNTAVSALMELTNTLNDYLAKANVYNDALLSQCIEALVKLISPICPFIGEEMWRAIGFDASPLVAEWPVADPDGLVADEVEIPVQINGKLRESLFIAAEKATDRKALEENALALDGIQKRIEGQKVVRIIAVPGRLVNLVVK